MKSVRHLRRAGLSLCVGLSLAGGASATNLHRDAVERLADDYVKAYVTRYPENAMFAGMAGAEATRLFDNRLSAQATWEAREDAWLAELADIDATALGTGQAWVTYGFLKEALESSRDLRVCQSLLWPVSQLEGWQQTLAGLASMQAVDSEAARERLLQQWSHWPAYLQTEQDNLRAGLKQGYSTPRPSVERVVAQIDELLAAPWETSPLASPAQRSKDAVFAKTWQAWVESALLPAMRRYRDFLKQDYLPQAREELSLLAHPQGDRCYAASLRRYTGLPTPAAEISAAGEAAVASSEREAKRLAKRLYGSDDLAGLRAHMQADPANHFNSREEVLAYSQAALGRARKALPQFVHRLPKAEVVIEPMPAFEEQGMPPHYTPPAADGSRPGSYAISLYAPDKQNKSTLEATAFHEAIPGHHLQGAAAQNAGASHPITQLLWNSGYGEGWAVYAEAVADEFGLFSSDLARLGRRLQTPTGMVADPGLHLKRWTRQQTIDYLLAHRSDYSPEYAASQTDRMSVMPGQLTTYFVGAFEFMALRRQAEQALGPAFDLRAFHDRVLERGAITLPMLRESIRQWIDSQRPRAKTDAKPVQ